MSFIWSGLCSPALLVSKLLKSLSSQYFRCSFAGWLLGLNGDAVLFGFSDWFISQNCLRTYLLKAQQNSPIFGSSLAVLYTLLNNLYDVIYISPMWQSIRWFLSSSRIYFVDIYLYSLVSVQQSAYLSLEFACFVLLFLLPLLWLSRIWFCQIQ